jgi:LysR family transcriptional regulator, cys regulon transcriptional activator
VNLHQLRFVQEAVRRNLNLTETAKALFTSQPGISKAILELEEELGVDIFVRHGKRLRRVTEPGQQVLKSVDVILREVANLKRIGDEYSKQDAGRLSIATTHTQARYVLPEPVTLLRKKFPKVQVSLHQGTPEQVAQMLLDDTADIGLATESLSDFDDLVTLPCYEWQHVVVVPIDHPLASVERLSIEQLADYPLISYQPAFTGRRRIDQAFAQRRLKPNIALEAIDSDVIKTYVRSGLGVGIMAEMAMAGEPASSGLVCIPAVHLFGQNTSRVAFRRGAYLRNYVLTFAELLSPRLTRPLIERAMSGQGEHFDL